MYLTDKLLSVLKSAHSKNVEIELHSHNETVWCNKVMAHINEIGPLNTDNQFIDSMFWKFVPAVCILIALLATLIIRSNIGFNHMIAEVFFNQSLSVSFFEPFKMI
ncbi:MAG: hypothetical protein K9L30_11420 [Desulfobacterales bacterium]|nr:hypothetical protein [Desulfobacterales bacterium]